MMNKDHEHKWRLLVDGPDCNECEYWATLGMARCECGVTIGPSGIEEILNGERQAVKLSPKDKLMQAYEKAGTANALYVKKRYGRRSAYDTNFGE